MCDNLLAIALLFQVFNALSLSVPNHTVQNLHTKSYNNMLCFVSMLLLNNKISLFLYIARTVNLLSLLGLSPAARSASFIRLYLAT
jgi:hypothetical protein